MFVIQLHQYLGEVIEKVLLDSTLPGLIQIMTETDRTQIEHKAISKLYRALEDLKAVNTEYLKERWEREANSGVRRGLGGNKLVSVQHYKVILEGVRLEEHFF